MYYVADRYVRVDKKLLKKGEILPELPEGKIKWLLEAGAIHACDPEPVATYTATEKEAVEILEMVGQDGKSSPILVRSLEETEGELEDPEEELEDPEEEPEELEAPSQIDEVDEAELTEDEADLPEAPEIDAMEGIVIGTDSVTEPAKKEPEKKETAQKKTKTAKPKKEGATK